LIPNYEESGVLPPFIGESPTHPANQAPYKVNLNEFIEHYATSKERIAILNGYLNYRAKLKSVGITNGFQWVDGSFVENVEKIRGRAPNDIDLVSFAHFPDTIKREDLPAFLNENPDLFYPLNAKSSYKCDAYFVDLALPSEAIVAHTKYWFGLFSHQRTSSLWKGMLEISLKDDETDAFNLLIDGGSHAS
jgi:hypothetical protein